MQHHQQQQPIQVLIADDMEAHRRRLNRIVSAQSDMAVAAMAASGYEAVLLAARHRPDIILMDIEMEDKLAGINAAKQIHANLPEIKIIILTVHEDDNIVFAAFQSGITDYIIKTAKPEEIVDGIRFAHQDLSPIRPIIAKKIRDEFKRVKRNEESLMYVLKIISDLTPSELEVLRLLCENKTRKQIADLRSVEYETVKKQCTNILRKFDKGSMLDVVFTINELKIFDLLDKMIRKGKG